MTHRSCPILVATRSCHLRFGSSDKQILQCPAGYVLHIHSLLCSGQSPCPRDVQDNVYRCEGVPNCDVYQQEQEDQLIITVDYVCVQAKVLDTKCSSSTQLVSYFGVIRRADNESRKRNLRICNWMVNASKEEVVHIIFHYADWIYDCKLAVNITYIDCANKKWKTETVCGMPPNRRMITSCGPVKVTSRPTTDSYGNYIISYQKQEINPDRKSSIDHDSRSSSHCVLQPDILNPRILIPSLELQKSFSSVDSSMNQKFEPSNSIINFMEPTEHKDNSSQSGSSFNKPKLIILYTFFGIIILVLSVALIAVIISYHRLSKDNKFSGDSSEKTALWQDTPMETFLTNSLADGSMASDTIYPLPVPSDQILAIVHHDSIYENNDLDHRLSSGSGISTFLSGKHVSDFRDLIHTFQTGTFVVYDDLNQPNSSDEADIGFYQNAGGSEGMSNIYESIHGEEFKLSTQNNNRDLSYDRSEMNSKELNPCEDQQSHPCPDDYHYCINNDEYAIVHKPSKPPNDNTQHYDSNELQMVDSTANVDFRPTSGPYDRSRHSAIRHSEHTTHYYYVSFLIQTQSVSKYTRVIFV
ncbi:hypothetical protein Btru_034715 [Bulinus truncatus]|nr:hypothetical protein Btru_034715 [Bulinus truncatus]